MTKFAYKAKEGPKKIVSGIIDADSLDGAIAKILKAGYTPLDVKVQTAKDVPGQPKVIKPSFSFSKRVPLSEIVLFTRQMGDLIDAGVPILQALGIVERQTKHVRFKDMISQMYSVVKDGETLSGALSRNSEIFSPLYINMVKSGEVGGNLNITMNRLADFVEKDQETVSQIRTSLMYPMLILVVGGLTIFVLLTWVIPRITVIFEDLNSALPFPTVVLLAVSSFLSRFWWLVAGLIGFGILYLRRVYKTPSGKLWLDGMKLNMPLLGGFIREAEIARFARTLGTLLDSGVVIMAALESVELVIQNEVLKQEVKKVRVEVIDGVSLTEALKGKMAFTDAAVSMISVGEESGQIHNGLYKLANYYDRQTQRFIKGVLSMMEPVLILLIGSVVGFVVIAMLMPMFRMNLMVQ